MTEEFPSNSKTSHTAKEQKREVKQVTKEPAADYKKSIGGKFRDTFIKADFRSVLAAVAMGVFVPAIKDMLADASRQGVEKMLYGEPRSASRYTGRPSAGTSGPKFNYAGISSGTNRNISPPPGGGASSGYAYESILVEDRGQAELVLEAMYDILEEYGQCSIGDFYDLVGRTGDYTDRDRGWKDLKGSEIIRVHEGYLFRFPRPGVLTR